MLSPMIGGIVVAVLFCAMAFYVLPKFERALADFNEGASLPWLTRLILQFGRGGMVLAGALLGIGMAASGLERNLRWLRWVSGGLAVVLLVIVTYGLVGPLAGTIVDHLSAG